MLRGSLGTDAKDMDEIPVGSPATQAPSTDEVEKSKNPFMSEMTQDMNHVSAA